MVSLKVLLVQVKTYLERGRDVQPILKLLFFRLWQLRTFFYAPEAEWRSSKAFIPPGCLLAFSWRLRGQVEVTLEKLRQIVIIRPRLVKLSELLTVGVTDIVFLSSGTMVNTF